MMFRILSLALAAGIASAAIGVPTTAGAQSPTIVAQKSTDGRKAAQSRQKQCGAEWRAAKAAGKVEKGMTWPKYWSACNKRLKAKSA